MAAEIDPILQIGGGAGGFAAISYVGWKLYQLIKSDVKQDNKGDKVDAGFDKLTTQLQIQLDKAIARSDTMQAQFSQLQKECAIVSAQLATAQARTEFLAKENDRLSGENSNLKSELVAIRGRISQGSMS